MLGVGVFAVAIWGSGCISELKRAPLTDGAQERLIAPSPHPTLSPPPETLMGQDQEYTDGAASEDPPIAHWNTVPYQEVSSGFLVGVLAFHASGIREVAFQVGSQAEMVVRRRVYNPITRTLEYFLSLPAGLPSGEVQVRARVIPYRGIVRVLPPLSLSYQVAPGAEAHVSPSGSDGSGTGSREAPFATIKRAAQAIAFQHPQGRVDGGRVLLLPGSYALGAPNYTTLSGGNRWLTIEPAPGVTRAQVQLTQAGGLDGTGLRTPKLRVRSLRVAPPSGGTVLENDEAMSDALWIEDCELVGTGRTSVRRWHAGWSEVYVTDTLVHKAVNGVEGAKLQRGVTVQEIASDAFSNSALVVNSSARNIDHRGTEFHPDVFQFYGLSESALLYRVTANDRIYGQGLFAGVNIHLNHIAFIECDFDNLDWAGGVGRVFQFGGITRNLYVRGSRFRGPANWIAGSGQPQEVVFEDTVFEPGGPPEWQGPGVRYRGSL
jgi:hypothetical protein